MSGADPSRALEALSSTYGGLVALMDRFAASGSARERRSVLISVVSAAWKVRDAAAEAYAALEYQADADGLDRGVLE